MLALTPRVATIITYAEGAVKLSASFLGMGLLVSPQTTAIIQNTNSPEDNKSGAVEICNKAEIIAIAPMRITAKITRETTNFSTN